jgi:hypothetical protein
MIEQTCCVPGCHRHTSPICGYHRQYLRADVAGELDRSEPGTLDHEKAVSVAAHRDLEDMDHHYRELEILARHGTTAEVRTAVKAEQERRERPEMATLPGSGYDAPER